MAEGWAREWIQEKKKNLEENLDETKLPSIKEQLKILNKASIVSVALDSASVFKLSSPKSESCCGGTFHTPAERKAVKEKAIEAMAKDGVDISNHLPKTIEEVLPSLLRPSTQSLCSTSVSSVEEDEDEDYLLSSEEESETKIVDKLIILCSCGDAMKDYLVRRAKSVEEWNVDGPTEKLRCGEKNAYRRVSLEIKNEVYGLMEDLFAISEHASELSI